MSEEEYIVCQPHKPKEVVKINWAGKIEKYIPTLDDLAYARYSASCDERRYQEWRALEKKIQDRLVLSDKDLVWLMDVIEEQCRE